MKTLTLNESQLQNIVSESIRQILQEVSTSTVAKAAGTAAKMAAHNGPMDAIARKAQGKRTKSSKDYADQAQRLHRGALDRAKKEDDEVTKKINDGNKYASNKYRAIKAYDEGRRKDNKPNLPQFGKDKNY